MAFSSTWAKIRLRSENNDTHTTGSNPVKTMWNARENHVKHPVKHHVMLTVLIAPSYKINATCEISCEILNYFWNL